jgi:hypothetical protein
MKRETFLIELGGWELVVRDLVGGWREAAADPQSKAATSRSTPPSNRTRVFVPLQVGVDYERP